MVNLPRPTYPAGDSCLLLLRQISYLTVMVTRSDHASCEQVGGAPEDVTGEPGVSLFGGPR